MKRRGLILAVLALALMIAYGQHGQAQAPMSPGPPMLDYEPEDGEIED